MKAEHSFRRFFPPLGAAGVAGPYFAILGEHSLAYALPSLGFETLCKTVFSCWDSHANKQLTLFYDFS